MNTSKYLVPVVGLLTVVAAGCSDDDDVVPGPSAQPVTQTSRVRVMHLSPDAPAVDVFVNGSDRVVSGLSFPDTTEYLEVPAGTYDFNVAPAGGSAADSVLDVEGVTLAADKSYTAVAFNRLGSIQALALEDNLGSVPAGQFRIRAIHTAPDVGEVDIWNITDPATPAPLYTDVPFGGVGDYVELPIGEYVLGIDVDNDATPDLSFAIPALPEGSIANVYAVQDAIGDLFLLAHFADATTARIDPIIPAVQTNIRVLHLSPDAPAVDVYVNSELKAVSDLEFSKGTDFLSIDQGTYSFNVVPAGGMPSDSVLDIVDIALEGNQYYTAVAFDELANITALPLVDDLSEVAAGSFRVRAIHAAAGVEQVDIWNITDPQNPAPLYVDVDFGAVGEYAELPVAAYTLGFDLTDDGTPEVSFQLPTLEEGEIANIFAVNDGAVFLLAQLKDGSTARIDAIQP